MDGVVFLHRLRTGLQDDKTQLSIIFAQIIFYRRYFADNIITIDLYSGKKSNNKVSISPERRMV